MIKHSVYWYSLRKAKITQLRQDLIVDIVIVGGGIAGLMCAQKLKRHNKNLKIAVVEATFCGGGASGKSSGFITPDSELELSDLVENYNETEAQRIWEFVKGGVRSIRNTIERRNILCDFSIQDSLFIANSQKSFSKVKTEYDIQRKLGYDARLYTHDTMHTVIGSTNYSGAVRYKDTYGIIAYLYCQDLKEVLMRDGIDIYEETPVQSLSALGVTTEHGYSIQAKTVVVCTDRFLPSFNLARQEIYHAQTFLAVSEPLAPETVRKLFPQGPLMVWDTDLIYQYYRIVEGNRLLLGAASLLYTYARSENNMPHDILHKMTRYLEKKFPGLPVTFEYIWPGLIGVSKDFLPIAGKDPVMKNVFFAGAGAGLPWAAALGEYIADKILHNRSDFDAVFAPDRRFPLSGTAQVVLTTPVSFAISHGIKKYFH